MKKTRLYLDTSIISHMDQQDAPERMAETKLFWELLKRGEFDVSVSGLAIQR